MIAKIRKGADFRGLASYLTRNDRGEVLDMVNLSSSDPGEAASEMQVAASVSTRTKAPVMHIMVSYSTAEAPTRDQMRADAAEVLAGLGLARNQAMVIRHSDAGHVHLHIAANRVGPDGKAVSDSHSFAKTEATLRRIEERRGWKVTQGRLAPGPDGARMTGPRTSRDPHQFTAPHGVRQALLTSKSWPELRASLKNEGWKVEIVKRPGQKPGALLIGPSGERVAAGRVDRAATLARLESRLGRAPRVLANQPASEAAHTAGAPTPHVRGRRGPDLLRAGGRKKGGANQKAKAAAQQAVSAFAGLLTGTAGGLGAGLSRHRRPGRGPRLGL